MGLVLSLLLFAAARRWERNRMERDFERAASDRVSAVRGEIRSHLIILKSLVSFYAASSEVERNEFRDFVTSLLWQHPGIRALEWIPRVPDSERASYEAAARDEGFGDFQITELAERSRMVRAPKRGEYFPVYFVEPYKGNESALGFDIASDPHRLEALNRSRETGRMIATERITLVQEREKQFGFLVFAPVYRRGLPTDTPERRRDNLEGFVLGVFRAGDIVEEAVGQLEPAGVNLCLHDESARPGEYFLHFHSSRMSPRRGGTASPEHVDQRTGLRHIGAFKIAGRKWSILCTPTRDFIAGGTTWQPWGMLTGGLLVTALLTVYLVSTMRHTARTEHLARRLLTANQELESEVADRGRAEERAEMLARFPSENPNPVIRVSAEGVVLYGNEASKFLLGASRSQEGKVCSSLWWDSVRDALRSGQSRDTEVKCGDRTFALTCAPVAGADYVNVYALDISEGKRTDLELRRAKAAAEAASLAKSEFLANMSHEIRTPMTAILGFADLLTDRALSRSDRDGYVATIRRNGEHLLTLIDDILDLSKVEAGKLVIEMSRCSLVSIISDVISMMRVRAGEKRISLSVEYTGELPETIDTDEARLRQALFNLVGNAIKFTEQGGVRVEVAFLGKWLGDRPAVRIRVIDTGVGISAEKLPYLFQPFAQADASTSRRYGGTGLGLAITHHIAELLGGELTSASVPGEGSTFTLTIPTGDVEGVRLARPSAELLQAPAPARVSTCDDLAHVRVLLAEDGIENQRLIQVLLSKAGAEVETALNGRLAVERAMAEHFDVILMDMQMPEMDGYEATSALRNRGYSGPILALTADAMARDRRRCMAAGCDDHLTKPIDRARLIEAVAEHSGKERTEPEQPDESAETTSPSAPEAIFSQFADDPDLADIIEDFVSGLPPQLKSMQEALDNNHFEELHRSAHQLKGVGGSCGYPAITEIAGTLEGFAKARDGEGARLALKELEKLSRLAARGHERPSLTREGER